MRGTAYMRANQFNSPHSNFCFGGATTSMYTWTISRTIFTTQTPRASDNNWITQISDALARLAKSFIGQLRIFCSFCAGEQKRSEHLQQVYSRPVPYTVFWGTKNHLPFICCSRTTAAVAENAKIYLMAPDGGNERRILAHVWRGSIRCFGKPHIVGRYMWWFFQAGL